MGWAARGEMMVVAAMGAVARAVAARAARAAGEEQVVARWAAVDWGSAGEATAGATAAAMMACPRTGTRRRLEATEAIPVWEEENWEEEKGGW